MNLVMKHLFIIAPIIVILTKYYARNLKPSDAIVGKTSTICGTDNPQYDMAEYPQLNRTIHRHELGESSKNRFCHKVNGRDRVAVSWYHPMIFVIIVNADNITMRLMQLDLGHVMMVSIRFVRVP